MTNHDKWLDTSLSGALDVLQHAPDQGFDQHGQTYYAIGVIESLLGQMSESSQLTEDQQDIVSQIGATLHDVTQPGNERRK